MSKGSGLLIGAVALLILGLFFLPFVIDSVKEATAADTNGTLTAQDHRVLGLAITGYLLVIVGGSIALGYFGIRHIAN